ncbi:uncharacterized protein LOC126267642 [Schistocerca gregaria]|uniref:uncharacterized protein LOC126267642 n=1 Tax=Schistocerca gregaria TaxID=7010 RepID=UPI00211E6120|nr:uncharacterized protein LOC126267642 [Schistocerca gregaria]
MAIATEATWAAFPLVQQLFSSNGEVPRLLPLPFWLPLDIYTSPTYEVIYVVQVLLIPLSTTSLFSDFVFVDLMMRIAAELEILNYSISGLQNIKNSVSTKSKNEYKSVDRGSCDSIQLQLAKNVKHHQQILRCVVLLEEAMNTGVFILFLATTIALSSNIFAATASDKLLHSAFSCGWVDCDTRFRRNLIIFSMAARRPLEFTVGKTYKLSKETFLQVCCILILYGSLPLDSPGCSGPLVAAQPTDVTAASAVAALVTAGIRAVSLSLANHGRPLTSRCGCPLLVTERRPALHQLRPTGPGRPQARKSHRHLTTISNTPPKLRSKFAVMH